MIGTHIKSGLNQFNGKKITHDFIGARTNISANRSRCSFRLSKCWRRSSFKMLLKSHGPLYLDVLNETILRSIFFISSRADSFDSISRNRLCPKTPNGFFAVVIEFCFGCTQHRAVSNKLKITKQSVYANQLFSVCFLMHANHLKRNSFVLSSFAANFVTYSFESFDRHFFGILTALIRKSRKNKGVLLGKFLAVFIKAIMR